MLRLGENPSSPTAQSDPSVIYPERLRLEILSRLVRTANPANKIFYRRYFNSRRTLCSFSLTLLFLVRRLSFLEYDTADKAKVKKGLFEPQRPLRGRGVAFICGVPGVPVYFCYQVSLNSRCGTFAQWRFEQQDS